MQRMLADRAMAILPLTSLKHILLESLSHEQALETMKAYQTLVAQEGTQIEPEEFTVDPDDVSVTFDGATPPQHTSNNTVVGGFALCPPLASRASTPTPARSTNGH